jgi:hypothetical protein
MYRKSSDEYSVTYVCRYDTVAKLKFVRDWLCEYDGLNKWNIIKYGDINRNSDDDIL